MYQLLRLFYAITGVLLFGVEFTAQAGFLPVCHRTASVKVFLEQALKKECKDITEAELGSVTRVAVANREINEFKPDDFSGLKGLEILNIRSNPYTHLPEGLLADLVKLKTLVIISTTLRHYPDDFLANNPLIENLHIFRNQVRSISESILNRLEAAKNLKVIDFDDSLQGAEKTRLRRLFPEGGRVDLAFH